MANFSQNMHLFLRIVINVTRLVIQCSPKFKREFENSFVVNELNSSQNWKQWTMPITQLFNDNHFTLCNNALCIAENNYWTITLILFKWLKLSLQLNIIKRASLLNNPSMKVMKQFQENILLHADSRCLLR